jgi:Concanavalin A-like lectin/glucanases superfamily
MPSYNTPARLFNFNNLPPTEGLIAAWNLSNVNDNFGTNHLTNNNAATFVAGKIGNAVSLNGTTQFLSIVDNANLSGAVGKKFTFCGWFKVNDLSTRRTILSKYTSAGNQREYLVFVETGTNNLKFIVSPDGTGGAEVTVATANNSIFANVWYFFTAWYDGNNIHLELNADNNIVKTPHTTDIFNGTGDFIIGKFDATAFFSGQIDAIRVYGHTTRVLTRAERLALYFNGIGREYVSNNIVSSDEVNRELDQLIELFSGITTDTTPKINSDIDSAPLIVNQLGSSEIFQGCKLGSKTIEVLNNGQLKSYLATGNAPFVITNASTGLITNLNVDLLDGVEAADILQITSKLTFIDTVIFTGNLTNNATRRLVLSTEKLIGMYARSRVAASVDSVVSFRLGVYRSAITYCTLALPNTQDHVAIFNFVGSAFVVETDLYEITASYSGSTPPIDVTVGIILSQEFI